VTDKDVRDWHLGERGGGIGERKKKKVGEGWQVLREAKKYLRVPYEHSSRQSCVGFFERGR
jgi:hypothetical protein